MPNCEWAAVWHGTAAVTRGQRTAQASGKAVGARAQADVPIACCCPAPAIDLTECLALELPRSSHSAQADRAQVMLVVVKDGNCRHRTD